MGFFGAVFVALTAYLQLNISSAALAAPFAIFAGLALTAAAIIRSPGNGIVPSQATSRAITWSSTAEGIAIGVAPTVLANLHRLDWYMPVVALVVGLHFLPIAFAARFKTFAVLGAVLILAAFAGFIVPAPVGGEIAGFTAAAGLWIASVLALRRDWRAKRSSVRVIDPAVVARHKFIARRAAR